MGVIVALVLDYQFGTARFQNFKHKASRNAFLIYIGPFLMSANADFGYRTLQKYEKYKYLPNVLAK